MTPSELRRRIARLPEHPPHTFFGKVRRHPPRHPLVVVRTVVEEDIVKALSIRQPWAWAIIAGHKKYENREWQTSYRRPLLIHAGKAFYEEEYRRILKHARRDGFAVPAREAFDRGGIIGRVDLVEIVIEAKGDPWFSGPYGWRLDNPQPLPFRPWTGQQRLFEVADGEI